VCIPTEESLCEEVGIKYYAMVNKAFIFDMDGVLVDSERQWLQYNEESILKEFFDAATREAIGSTTGLGVRGLYDKATKLGAKVDFDELSRVYEVVAMKVYDEASLTEGAGRLAKKLEGWGFRLGLVTSSPQSWINRVVPRLTFANRLEAVISLGERPDLKTKPEPDAYLEAMKILGASAALSVVLEDSNLGIAAGKAAGAYVIGFSGNLVDGYEQTGADSYADTMEDVIKLVESFDRD